MPYAKRYKPIRPATKQARIRSAMAASKAARSEALARRRSGPGYTRTEGFYGRYAGPNSELKFFDTTNSFLFDATGEVPATGQLNLIPQGVTESQRVGRKCVIKSIHMRGIAVNVPAAAANSATTCYMYVVLDTQCNGAAAAVTDVLSSNNLSIAFNNLANSQRFRILKKFAWKFQATAGATTAYNNSIIMYKWNKKCNIPLEFSSTTGAITEIRSNNIFLLAGTDGQTDDIVTLAGNTRVRFSDGS